MPIILLALLRPFIMWVVTITVTTVIADLIAAMLKAIVGAVAKHYNIPEDDAKVVVVNKMIDIAALLGVGTGALFSKIGIKAADYLGVKAVKVATKKVAASSAAKIAIADALPTGAAKAKGIIASFFAGNAFWKILGPLMLLQQVGDWLIFGRPQLQGYFDAIFGKDAVKIPSATDAPPGFSNSEWSAFYSGLESAGVAGIESPAARQSLIYSREQLALLVHWQYGQQLKNAAPTTANAIQKAVQPYLVFPGKVAQAGITKTVTPTSTPVVQTTKVFVGAIGGGTLSSATGFTARPDDLIVSMSELETALRNNLVPFFASVLGRFVYETKVVSTVTSKDGFTQRGQAQQVVSGYTTAGAPKYRTVVNKFAVADIYFLSETGTRTKAGRIVLGPTDAVNFRPALDELSRLDLDIKGDISTPSLSGVSDVKQNGSTTTLSKPDEQPLASANFSKASSVALSRLFRAGASNGNPPPDQLYADTGKRIYIIPNLQASGAGIFESTDEYIKAHDAGEHYDITKKRLKDRYGIDFESLPTRNPADLAQQAVQAGYETQMQYDAGRGNVQNPIYSTTSVAELLNLAEGADTTRPIGTGPVCTAENLTQFFNARGEQLPSVETRSVLYEQYGLGTRSFYTATSEQNVKLLSKLKEQAGCSI